MITMIIIIIKMIIIMMMILMTTYFNYNSVSMQRIESLRK